LNPPGSLEGDDAHHSIAKQNRKEKNESKNENEEKKQAAPLKRQNTARTMHKGI
jgi:hypothetical protein